SFASTRLFSVLLRHPPSSTLFPYTTLFRSRGRTSHDASRHALRLRQILVVDPVDAQRAFLHHSAVLVELARAVRTGPGAQFAADAERRIDQHDAVLRAFVGGAGRAHCDAIGLLAMITVLGKVHGAAVLAVAHLERVNAIEP